MSWPQKPKQNSSSQIILSAFNSASFLMDTVEQNPKKHPGGGAHTA